MSRKHRGIKNFFIEIHSVICMKYCRWHFIMYAKRDACGFYNLIIEMKVSAKFAQIADDGKTYRYKFYSLSAIIAVGYRTNSARATQFRQWATKILDGFKKQRGLTG